jgi:hypothetical protein
MLIYIQDGGPKTKFKILLLGQCECTLAARSDKYMHIAIEALINLDYQFFRQPWGRVNGD